jgi:coenzyme F420-0:L-glutamate ligase/coenzyme F420-1:gamma-L-glutamate ligase
VISITPIEDLPEIRKGDDLGRLIAGATDLEDSDVVVIAQKVVSKAEGRVVDLDDVEPSKAALELAGPETDPRKLEVILTETNQVVRARGGLLITETRHGFVCASAGVDQSNTEAGTLVLLPVAPDTSARKIRASIKEHSGRDVAVIVSDSFGRPFRRGTTDVAIGLSGLAPLRPPAGDGSASAQIAIADELASAANLVRPGKADGFAAVVVRGATAPGDGTAHELLMPRARDLFR